MEHIVVGIDIGTSKVCALIGKTSEDGNITIIGKGLDYCSGVKKGIIVDVDNAAKSIRESMRQAEVMADLKVYSAYVTISGSQIDIVNNRISVNVSNQSGEITQKDVEKTFIAARGVSLPQGRQIIDIIPRQYIVDEYDSIVNPIGMIGTKLEVDFDIIAAKVTTVQNIIRSMDKAGFKVDGIIVEPLAISEVTLTTDEKEMGVVLIDVGGSTTNISLFEENELVFCGSIPVGGDHISNDISLGLKISYQEAEKLKREYELALTSLIKNDHEITVNEINDEKKKKIKISDVVEIIEARVQEIFIVSKNLLHKLDLLRNYGAGIVLSGGGISYVDGNVQLAYEVFGISTRVAVCKGPGVIEPEYATAVGIIKYILSQKRNDTDIGSDVKANKKRKAKSEFKLLDRISKLVESFF